MKKLIIMALFLPLMVFGQAQLVLNSNPFIVLSGGTNSNPINIVLDNPNTNAIIWTGTPQVNGGIISENEYNIIKWIVGPSVTGVYSVPFTATSSGPAIPTLINITSAGVGSGNLKISTYRSITWDNAANAPSFITNFNSSIGGVNNSAKILDRFWMIDANGYTTKPEGDITFNYSDIEHTAGSNSIIEANLQAQRYNTTNNNWDGYIIQGTQSVGSYQGQVSGISFTASNFEKGWVLVDNRSPLPIDLINFDAECNLYKINLEWTTASETSNDYFTIERSINSINWEIIGIVDGAGNSASLRLYSFVDSNLLYKHLYYRLKQTDFDGKFKYSPIINITCDNMDNSGFDVFPNPNNGDGVKLSIPANIAGKVVIVVRNIIGEEFYSNVIITQQNSDSVFVLDLNNKLAKGVYIITATSNNKVYNKRLVVD